MTESIFTIHKYEIPFSNYGEPIYILPFGDVHRDSNCDEERWLQFTEWAKKKKRAYFLGMGDYLDFCSTSERFAMQSAKFHDTTIKTLDDLAYKRTFDFLKEIEFMKPKLIGLIEGNHHFKFFNSGTTSTQKMCENLNCRYLGESSFIRLIFNHIKSGKAHKLDIWAHHGAGGARTTGGSINSVEKMTKVANADLYFCGHDHKKWVAMNSKLVLSRGHGNLKLKQKKMLLVRTGSYQKGYEPDQSSFVVHHAMQPNDLGSVKIEVTPLRSCKNGEENAFLDLHASI